ncbi:MAG: alpha/beta hydrolase [bacterium]|nr:alpha/beta hydrolase [bacterium]
MINSKLFIIPIVLLQFSQGLAQTNVTNSTSSAEQKQVLVEACNNLLKKNDAYVTVKRDKIFSKEFEDFNSTIDSLEQSVQQLVNKHKLRTETDAQLIDSLLTETKFKHRRYRLLYPNNYHRFADLKKRATVPGDYFENVMKGSFDNPSLINFKEYRRCVNFYLDILSAAEYKFSHLEYVPLKRIDNRYDAIAGLDAHQTVKDFFIKEHFTSNIWTYRVEAFDYAYAKALEDVKNEKYLQKIKDTYKMGHDRRNDASEIKAYKTVDDITLNAHIFYPENHDKTQLKPAHLFFHGGGWAIGLPEWSYGACKGAVKDGRVAIAFDFRLRNVYGTDVKTTVTDALTAIAWVRENAKDLGIDPNKVLVDGFSSGAQLALISSMIENPKDFGVISDFSSRPDALILGSCPYDVNGRDVYDIDYDTKTISPLYLIKENLPPILAFHAEEDRMVKFSEFEKFKNAIQKTKNSFTSRSYPGMGHFFEGSSEEDREERRKLRQEFLLKHGFVVE